MPFLKFVFQGFLKRLCVIKALCCSTNLVSVSPTLYLQPRFMANASWLLGCLISCFIAWHCYLLDLGSSACPSSLPGGEHFMNFALSNLFQCWISSGTHLWCYVRGLSLFMMSSWLPPDANQHLHFPMLSRIWNQTEEQWTVCNWLAYCNVSFSRTYALHMQCDRFRVQRLYSDAGIGSMLARS